MDAVRKEVSYGEAATQGDRLNANSVGAVVVIATPFGAVAPTVGIALGIQVAAIIAGRSEVAE